MEWQGKMWSLKREVFLIDFKGFRGKCKGVYIKYMTEAFYAESLKSNKKTNALKLYPPPFLHRMPI